MSARESSASGPDGGQVLLGLAGRPGGAELLAAAERRPELSVALVGGAVRDLLLGRLPRELDVVAEDAEALAGELLPRLGPVADAPPQLAREIVHERFGTAVLQWSGGRIDIARRRAELYPAPGALPEVRPGTAEEDLRRRDFTVNAIAVPLGGPRRGELQAVENALADLAGGRLRVLHEHSFLDDPTRLLRLARYGGRLGFEAESATAELAAAALADGALGTVSPARLGAELRLALGEADPLPALSRLQELGVLAALQSGLSFDEPLARRALALLPADGHPAALLVGLLLLGLSEDPGEDPRAQMFALLDGLEFPARERDRAIRTALAAPGLARRMDPDAAPSQLYEALAGEPLEAVALAGALGGAQTTDAAAVAGEFLDGLRHVRLRITGEDLLAAGVPAGPQVGARLAAALRRRLDGELEDDPEAELRAALEAHL